MTRTTLLASSALFLTLACAPAQQPAQQLAQNANAPAATPAASTQQASPQQSSTPNATPTPGAASKQSVSEDGDIRVTAITHASLQLEYGGKVIHVDPTSPGDYSAAKQADLVLVTDIHPDHLDPAAIKRIRKPGAPVVAPKAAADKIENPTVISNGETKTVAGISIEAVPMYNLTRGPAAGQLFHDKGRGNGYVLTLGGKRIFFAGDTECVPEIKALANIDVAFVPMNLPYTMPPEEAAEAVRGFKPKVAIPYHYRGSDPKVFESALAGSGVQVKLIDWYYK
jgi:L-ascorbate metabolism protein UlaG (beta-lactamase superfamily)